MSPLYFPIDQVHLYRAGILHHYSSPEWTNLEKAFSHFAFLQVDSGRTHQKDDDRRRAEHKVDELRGIKVFGPDLKFSF